MSSPMEILKKAGKIAKEKLIDPAPTGPSKVKEPSKEAYKAVKDKK